MKARILSGSFSPGARSTPDDTSTPGARVICKRLGDIAGIKPARQHEWNARSDALEQRPVERLAEPAGPRRVLRRARVEDQPVGDLRVYSDRRRDRRARRSAAPSSPAGRSARAPPPPAPASPCRAIAACRASARRRCRASVSSLASTVSATLPARPCTRSPKHARRLQPEIARARRQRTRSRPGRRRNPAPHQALRGVFRPQILIQEA